MIDQFLRPIYPCVMLLPILAFLCLWCLRVLAEREDWRVGFLKAALQWGAATLLMTELLSVFSAIRPTTLALAWILVIATSLYVIRRHLVEDGDRLIAVAKRTFAFPAEGGWWSVPLIPAVIIALTTATIGLIAPPNNWDSMTYHLSRVEHWRANASVAHYPTNVVWQLYLNPWAEFAILQFQTLGFGSDRFANLVQWFALVGSMVGVSLLLRLLGGSLFAQSLAALVVASTPMVILQSSSTQNDVVCGFFVIAAAYFAFERRVTAGATHEIYFPVSVALAIATKGTAYPILFPFVAYAVITGLRHDGLRPGVRSVGVLVLVVFLLNAGHWSRNFGLWQHPLGDPEWLRQYQNESFGVAETLSNVVRNVALHLGTPSSRVNASIEAGVQRIHDMLGIRASEPALTFLERSQIVPGPELLTHEDYAGNGMVLVLSMVAVTCVLVTHGGRRLRPFALLLVLSSLCFCLSLKWAPFNSRLHTPLFLLSAPMVGWLLTPRQFESLNVNTVHAKHGAVLVGASLIAGGVVVNEWVIARFFGAGGTIHSGPLRAGIWIVDGLAILCGILAIVRSSLYLRIVTGLVVLVFTIGAVPWITLNQLRPLISTAYAPNIFDRSRTEQMFANRSGLVIPYTKLISMLAQLTSCHEIGLKIQVGAFEYPLWEISRYTGLDLVFRHIAVTNKSARIGNGAPRVSPCPIVVIGGEEQGDPDVSGLGDMREVWSAPPIRLLVRLSPEQKQ